MTGGSFQGGESERIGFTSWFSRAITLESSLAYVAAASCKSVELAAMPEYLSRGDYVKDLLNRHGLEPTAVSLGVPFFYSDGELDLHSSRRSVRRTSVDYVRRSIDFAHQIGADFVYVCSMSRGPEERHAETLELLGQGVTECADYAESAGISFGLEPFPRGELSTIQETNLFISRIRSANLGILLDTGHAAISGEDLVDAARRSEGKISHVHLNNNDGVSDLHWPPQRGKLRIADFRGLLVELGRQNYRHGISIELSSSVSIVRSISQSRRFVERALRDVRRPASSGHRISS